jgi:hypothetical protein
MSPLTQCGLPFLSFPRRRESSTPHRLGSIATACVYWIPAFAGTTLDFGQAPSPLLLATRGRRLASLPLGARRRGRSAGRRNVSVAALRQRASGERLAPAGAPSAASFRRVLAAYRPQSRASWDEAPAAVSRLQPVPVQPAPGRAVLMPPGRGPGASRAPACEAGPRAPHRPQGFRLMTPEAGAVVGAASPPDGPTTRTPHDGALRRTGPLAYSPA